MQVININANQMSDEMNHAALTKALEALKAIKNPDEATKEDIKTVQKELDELNEHLSQFGVKQMTQEQIDAELAAQAENAPFIAAQKAADRDNAIRSAMSAEADPLFYMWQAGEIDKQVWLDKRAEIRTRFSE